MLKFLAPAAAAAIVVAAGAPLVISTSTAAQVDVAASAVSVAQATAETRLAPESSDAAASDDDQASTAAPPPVSLRPIVEVVGASEDEELAVDEALARFRDAGLLLPDLQIVFPEDQDACRGHDGLFQPQFTPWRILVCSDLAFVATHELAHAWEAANLDDADRDRYTELRGLSTWDSTDAGWGERGVEDAAFMIQQNLMGSPADPTSDRWVERTTAYEALTGRPSPVLAAA